MYIHPLVEVKLWFQEGYVNINLKKVVSKHIEKKINS